MKLFAACIVALCLFGCAQKFTRLPERAEFKTKAPSEIFAQYQELDRCRVSFDKFLLYAIWQMPPADVAIKAWGEPNRTRMSWWTLLNPLVPIHCLRAWEWDIEGKTVAFTIDRPMAYGYEPRVLFAYIKEKK